MHRLEENLRLSPQHVLMGCALVDPAAACRILEATGEQDYTEPCLTIYRCFRALQSQGKPLNPAAVATVLGQEYVSLLAQLMNLTPSAAVTDHYIPLCQQQTQLRQLRELGKALSEVSTPDDASVLSQRYDQLRNQQVSGSRPVRTVTDLIGTLRKGLNTPKDYLPWPFHPLEGQIFAEPGDLIVLGGYPSAGKSAMALQCASYWSWKKRVGFYSLETAPEKLFARLVASMHPTITLPRLKLGNLSQQEEDDLSAIWPNLEQLQLEIIPASGMTVSDIAATAKARGHEIVVIDYLQLLRGSGGSRYEQVTNISLELHTMAQSMSIIVLALSQLRRPSLATAEPGMGDLRESGQIEQDADLILLLYPESNRESSGGRILNIVKNKEGHCQTLHLNFHGEHQRFAVRQGTGQSSS